MDPTLIPHPYENLIYYPQPYLLDRVADNIYKFIKLFILQIQQILRYGIPTIFNIII